MYEIKKLIKLIQKQYKIIAKEWENSDLYFPLNMASKKVDDIYKDESILNYIFHYRSFINNINSEFTKKLQNIDFKSNIGCRVKDVNSIQYKIDVYEKKEGNGKYPLKKCLNDLFGIRIILDHDVDLIETQKFIQKHFEIKCIISHHGEYEAVHVYFGRENNLNFQWELQIWNKSKEKINYMSHLKHKQGYTKWLEENKEV